MKQYNQMKNRYLTSLLIAALLIVFSAGSARADIVNLPVDADFLIFVFIIIVIFVIALFIVVRLKRQSDKKKHERPSSPEAEGISKF